MMPIPDYAYGAENRLFFMARTWPELWGNYPKPAQALPEILKTFCRARKSFSSKGKRRTGLFYGFFLTSGCGDSCLRSAIFAGCGEARYVGNARAIN
jgi:hypothetical protein